MQRFVEIVHSAFNFCVFTQTLLIFWCVLYDSFPKIRLKEITIALLTVLQYFAIYRSFSPIFILKWGSPAVELDSSQYTALLKSATLASTTRNY